MSDRDSSWRPDATVAALKARAEVLTEVRAFFRARDVLEVQTPLLGAHSVTDPDVQSIAVPGHGHLQTSPEYFMKRLLAAGMPSCYQLASAFRQGELGRSHNPEFTMLEWYRLDFDHQDLMQEVAALVDLVLGPGDYQYTRYADVVGEGMFADPQVGRDELDLAFSEGCERLAPGRHFVTHYPADQAALARLLPGDEAWAARFELIVDGVEIANGYWELDDAAEHRRRFSADARVRQDRGLAPVHQDEHFLAALEHGLPSCAGVALGFDRLMMLRLGAESLDQVLSFRI